MSDWKVTLFCDADCDKKYCDKERHVIFLHEEREARHNDVFIDDMLER